MRRWLFLLLLLPFAGSCGPSPGPVPDATARDLVRRLLADGDFDSDWCERWADDLPLCERHLRQFGALPPDPRGHIVASRRQGDTVVVTVAHGTLHTELQVVRSGSELVRLVDPVHWSGVRVVAATPGTGVSP
ncbi:MAG: hypothetical protein U0R64_04475 [Candidatus Nanopelagicales bacterium]